jgi:DNA-directed RNA polymerase subunit E'/Rpb7
MASNKGNKQNKNFVIYTSSVLHRTVTVDMQSIGKNINTILHTILTERYEGKCSVEGYIKPNSIKIVETSSGLVAGNKVEFEVMFQCQICFPVEGMEITCVAKNITKAGIRCESIESPSPLIVFVARDHHYSNDVFGSIKENAQIKVKVIGQRFELNDTHISIIGELVA